MIFYNICYGVNAFADPSRHEATYLFLQWAGGARMYTYLCFNPNGYQDPHHTYTLEDPYTAQSYKPQPLGAFQEIVPRTAPPITIRGGSEYRDVARPSRSRRSSPARRRPRQAAKALEDAWNKITERLGTENQVDGARDAQLGVPDRHGRRGRAARHRGGLDGRRLERRLSS